MGKQSTPAPAPLNPSSGGLPGNFGAVLGDGDDGEGNSITVTGSWAHTVTNKVSSSFTRTHCESKSFTIPAGEYCYHWTMSYSPKNGAKIMVYSNAIECVPEGNPVCCPPGTYRTGHPTWDCDKEVYLCGDRRSSSYSNRTRGPSNREAGVHHHLSIACTGSEDSGGARRPLTMLVNICWQHVAAER